MAPVADVWEAEPRHAEDAVDVRVQDGRLVLLVRLPERVAAEGEPGVVEEDVEPADLGDRPLDERHAALLVSRVELEREIGLDPLDPPRTTDHVNACLAQLAHGRCSDSARGTGDNGRLFGQAHRVSHSSGLRSEELD